MKRQIVVENYTNKDGFIGVVCAVYGKKILRKPQLLAGMYLTFTLMDTSSDGVAIYHPDNTRADLPNIQKKSLLLDLSVCARIDGQPEISETLRKCALSE